MFVLLAYFLQFNFLWASQFPTCADFMTCVRVRKRTAE